MKLLKIIRIILALVIFVPIVFFFLDFTGKLPQKLHLLLSLQWIPALLSVNVLVLSILVVLSLLFGRLYCSVICPLGVTQDILHRIASVFYKKKKKKKRSVYRKPDTWLRYALLGLTLIVFLAGSSVLLIQLDPYSIFGRMCSQLLHHPLIFLNNMVAALLNKAGNYTLYQIEQMPVVWPVFALSAFFGVLILVLSVLYGRLYCNTLCPVGTFLGLFSKISLFKIKIDASKCNHCSACERKCKSQCIQSRSMHIDHSRCVTCFNCIESCSTGAMKYGFRYKKVAVQNDPAMSDKGRRTFLLVSGAALTGAALAGPRKLVATGDSMEHRKPIMPPGAGDAVHFHRHCTGCQLCVSKCPMGVLKPAVLHYGLEGITQPRMAFSTHVLCTYECTICSDVCPTGALKKLSVPEKKLTQVGVAKLRLNKCVVIVDGTDCGACSEHCPTQAVHMVPYKNGLTRPEVNDSLCVGCGGCESICPVHPYQAIYVEGLEIQQMAKKPREAKKFEKKIDDFGF